MYFHSILGHVEGHIRGVKEVVREELLDHVTLVAKANNEIGDSAMRIHFQDVPENWFAANLYHGLRPDLRFLAESRAKASGQYHCFHAWSSETIICYESALDLVSS